MRHHIYLSCFGCILAISACVQNGQPARSRSLDAHIPALLEVIDREAATGFDGQVAIALDGEIVLVRSAGFADRERTIPVRDDTLFYVASLAKYIAAVTTLRAADEGDVSLDAPVSNYLPQTSPVFDHVTLSDLLAHTSGIPSSYVAEAETDRASALSAILPIVEQTEITGAFRYSNTGYDLVAIILETVLDQPYEDIVESHTHINIHVSDFAFWSRIDTRDPHIRAQPIDETPAFLEQRNYGTLASGGLLFSARGLVEWQLAIQRGDVLSMESLETLFEPRAAMSLGDAFYGGFLLSNAQMGRVLNARGYEDRGENATLNDYIDCGLTIAITTSSGPLESTGRPAYRAILTEAFESELAEFCTQRLD